MKNIPSAGSSYHTRKGRCMSESKEVEIIGGAAANQPPLKREVTADMREQARQTIAKMNWHVHPRFGGTMTADAPEGATWRLFEAVGMPKPGSVVHVRTDASGNPCNRFNLSDAEHLEFMKNLGNSQIAEVVQGAVNKGNAMHAAGKAEVAARQGKQAAACCVTPPSPHTGEAVEPVVKVPSPVVTK